MPLYEVLFDDDGSTVIEAASAAEAAERARQWVLGGDRTGMAAPVEVVITVRPHGGGGAATTIIVPAPPYDTRNHTPDEG